MKKIYVILLLVATAFGQGSFQGPGNTTVGSVSISTVAGLATVAGKVNGTFELVTDGASGSDCTTGSGSTLVVCFYNGSSWAAIGAPLASPVFTGVVTFPAGTTTAPGLVSSQSGTYGITATSATQWCMGTGASNQSSMCWTTAGLLRIISGGVFCMSSSATNGTTACDTGISRDAAGIGDFGTGAQGSKNGVLQASRYTVAGATTLSAAGDFILSAGWGTTASTALTAPNSKDAAAVITVTSSGTGQTANPTIQFLYHDLLWPGPHIPACSFIQNGGNDIFGDMTTTLMTTSQYTMQWNATPTATKTYQFVILCTGT